MATAAMLDLETMGWRNSSVILTFGAVKFNPYDIESEPSMPMYMRIDVDEQLSNGRTYDDDTMEWWGKQKESVREEAFGEEGRLSMVNFLNDLNRYLVGVDKIWCQGPLFDINILEHMMRETCGRPVPWQFWQIRDSRTLFDLGDDSAKRNNVEAHNALTDAFLQAKSVQQIYNDLGVKKKNEMR